MSSRQVSNKHSLLYNFPIYILLFFLGIGGLTFAPKAFGETSGNILAKIQTSFDQLTSLHAAISQTNADTSSQNSTTYTGEVYFQKPNNLRIVYTQPSEQIIVFDGTYLWIYTSELKQITKQKLDSASASVPIPLLFFAGASQIDQNEFRKKNSIKPVKLETLSGVSSYRIRIKPKSKSSQYKEQSFWVNATTLLPMKAKIIDAHGIMVTVTFSSLIKDVEIPAKAFLMSIPPGVELIDLTQQKNQLAN